MEMPGIGHLSRIEIASDPAQLGDLRRKLGRILDGRMPERDAHLIVQAVDEVVGNIIEHGYEGAIGDVQIDIDVTETEFRAWIRDQGRWFDPTAWALPDIGAHVRAGLTRGLGLLFVRSVMDELRYEETAEGWHELMMVKRLAR